MIAQTTAEFERYIGTEMHQLYQAHSSTEAALNLGIGVLNSTSTFLSNVCCALG
jgi:hypothetical protein